MTLTKEEIQKQIEAVRGLQRIGNDVVELKKQGGIAFYSDSTEDIGGELNAAFLKHLRTLTATLKPHLDEGQQLDV